MRHSQEPRNSLSSIILSMKEGHDGTIALIKDRKLIFSLEAEKDNGYRYGWASPSTFTKALELCHEMPDVIALSGWSKGTDPMGMPIGAGYAGLDNIFSEERITLGRPATFFSSSHERSHLLCAYGLSPYPQGEPCYALLWEGHFGAFYYIDEHVKIEKVGDVLDHPGSRFAFLYGLADPNFELAPGQIRLSDAGKLMAIAAYGTTGQLDEEGEQIISTLLDKSTDFTALSKEDFKSTSYHNIGVENPKFALLAHHLSIRLFDLFLDFAKKLIPRRIPLLVCGGCGLNCDWNSQWINSGLFSDVFIPPCANDSGSAIGTAIDAQLQSDGVAKISWSPYAGELPSQDTDLINEFDQEPFTSPRAAELLSQGKILGWVQGRYEVGPRALGNRSILASPFPYENLARLNKIKCREAFRPIAPVCLESAMHRFFHPCSPSPYMLEFRKVISESIPAVTHIDQSARPQSVDSSQNPRLFSLLSEFEKLTDIPVLCNTSLNFNGHGFINRLSDLRAFALKHNLDGFVFIDHIYIRKENV